MAKIFPMSPQALTGQQAQQEGAVIESARLPTTGRGTGPIAREVLGIGLPLQNRTTPKEEEGRISIPQSIYRIWNFTLEGNHGEISTLNFVATGR